MLTLYSDKSDFKKKLTVVVIWLVAIALSFLLMTFLQLEKVSLMIKILPGIIGIFMIAGILLRCKIARGFTLITLYFLALYPLITNFLVDGSFIFFLTDSPGLFSSMEAFFTNLVWAILFVIPIYFFSNDKAMDIFYIEPNYKEQLFFGAFSLFVIVLYVYFITVPSLEKLS